MESSIRINLHVMLLAFCGWALCKTTQAKDIGASIQSVSVESRGLKQSAFASIVVKSSLSLPVYVYWSDVTTWLPAEGHPNYTITEKAWKEGNSILLQSTIEIKKMLLSQLTYYYDYEKEHLVYYLPMTADIRSGDGQFIYHHTFDIPEKPATKNFTQVRFRVVDRPEPVVNYADGDEVQLQWRFLSRDENEFTMWRTLFKGPTDDNDLDYSDQMLYAEDFTHMYPDEVMKFDHINVTKKVNFVGRLYLVTFTMTMRPTQEADEALYVLFLKSRRVVSWDKALNLRLSTRLLRKNITSLLHDDVALALSYCNGNDVPVTEDAGYVSLTKNVENCVKCESYGNNARDLIFTKDRYLVRPGEENALVHSSYYPETKSIMYTYRNQQNKDGGEYFCRAILKNNKVVSRKFNVAWTEPVTLEASILYVNQTEAQIECKASGDPKPDLTVWRCDGDPYCNLKSTQAQAGFELLLTSGDPMTATLSILLPSAQLKKEAILCRASNKFDTKEEWLLFDDRVKIEQAELVTTQEEGVEEQQQEGGVVEEGAGDKEEEKGGNLGGGSILNGDAVAGVDIADDQALKVNSENANKDSRPVTESKDSVKVTQVSDNKSVIKPEGTQEENKVTPDPVESKKATEKTEENDLLEFAASGDGEN